MSEVIPIHFKIRSKPNISITAGAYSKEDAEALAATLRDNPDVYDVEIEYDK